MASHHHELMPTQLAQVVRLLVKHGFRKIKLAGGEPTTRPDLEAIIRHLVAIPAIELSMISNGTLLTPARIARYYTAGLRRINISINTFQPDRYALLQGGRPALLQRALQSVPLLIATGYQRPKINFIYFGPESDADLDEAIRFAMQHQIKITLLNELPDATELSGARPAITTADLIDRVFTLGVASVITDHDPGSFATLCFTLNARVMLEVGHHQVGQAGVYQRCTQCQLQARCRESVFAQRLTPDGRLQPCLLREDNQLDLRPYLASEWPEPEAHAQVAAFLAQL